MLLFVRILSFGTYKATGQIREIVKILTNSETFFNANFIYYFYFSRRPEILQTKKSNDLNVFNK